MGQVTVGFGPPVEVVTDEVAGAVFTNHGPATVSYSDSQNVRDVEEGSLASGASATLYGSVWLDAASRADVAYRLLVPSVESGSGAILPWATATAYVQGEPVTNGGHTYTANDAHTSGATFAGDLAAHWTLLPLTASDVGAQPVDSDLTALAAIAPSNDDLVQRKAGAWTNRTPAQVKTDLVLVKADVGLGNVDNTTDANKPVSTAQATADALAARVLVPTAVKTANYTAGANEYVPVDTTSGVVTITLPTAPADRSRVGVKHIIQGGTNAVTIACGGSDVFNKAGGSTSLTLPLVNEGMLLQYNAVTGIWYVQADNTPLSQLDLRYANLASPALTGTPTVPTAAQGTNTTQAASTAYVQTEAGLLIPKSLADAKGDIFVASGDNTVARKAAGVNGLALVTDSAQSDGLVYADASGHYSPAYDGALAQSYPYRIIVINAGNLRPTSGRLEGVKIPVPRTITVTNILVSVNQVGVTLTSGQNKVALLSSAGSKLGETADQSTAWLSTGEPTIMPIVGGAITIPGGPGVYVYAVVLCVHTGTAVGLRGQNAASLIPNGTLAATTFWSAVMGNLTGQTSIPGTITMSSNASLNQFFWVGLT